MKSGKGLLLAILLVLPILVATAALTQDASTKQDTAQTMITN